jgi:hypothetical protein
MIAVLYADWKKQADLCHGVLNHPHVHWHKSAEDTIEYAADLLLERLYYPDEGGRKTSEKYRALIGVPGLGSEAINWGDLYAVVEQVGDTEAYEVVIEEASPDCGELCNYISSWLKKWGWTNIIVRSEW